MRKAEWMVVESEPIPGGTRVFDVYKRGTEQEVRESMGQVWVSKPIYRKFVDELRVECAGCQTDGGRPMSRSCKHVRAFRASKSARQQMRK